MFASAYFVFLILVFRACLTLLIVEKYWSNNYYFFYILSWEEPYCRDIIFLFQRKLM